MGPIKNISYTFYISLIDDANPTKFKVDPTVDLGDFKVSIDGGNFEDLINTPTVSPIGSSSVKIILTAAEMNGNNIVVRGIDTTATIEWQEIVIILETSATVSVWDEISADHQTIGTTGKALIDAGAAGNPWETPIGETTPGTYGHFVTRKLLTFVRWIGLR
jgi:hypothetical protein